MFDQSRSIMARTWGMAWSLVHISQSILNVLIDSKWEREWTDPNPDLHRKLLLLPFSKSVSCESGVLSLYFIDRGRWRNSRSFFKPVNGTVRRVHMMVIYRRQVLILTLLTAIDELGGEVLRYCCYNYYLGTLSLISML